MFKNRVSESFMLLCSNGVKTVFLLSLFVSLMSGCYQQLPDPELIFTGTEDYIGSDSNEYTRYKLEVTNSDDYPDKIFAPAPELPPCGLNTNSSRTWVDIFDNNDNRLYGFCALSSSDDLKSLWFAVPKGDSPPQSVYIVINDRKCKSEYKSNSVLIGPECFPDLPAPQLVLTGTEDYIGSDSNEYTRYKLEVTNSSDFPDALFTSSPHLPPCGLNTSSSRTWVDIFDNNDSRLYGFCALSSSDGLKSIWFAVPKGDLPPESVYIVLNDRECDIEYKSNSINVGPECYPDLPTPQLVFAGTEDYIGSDSNEYTRYKLEVTNSSDFPDELFTSSPHLPPCGLNTSSSRTWVDIFDNTDSRLYGFCALSTSEHLKSIWFAVPKGDSPPSSVYIVLNDRECEIEYISNSVAIITAPPTSDFFGLWINEDPATPEITRIEISLSGSDLVIQEWGDCIPTDCDWGTESTPVSDGIDSILDLSWDQVFVIRTQQLELVGPNRLMSTTFSHYVDGSGRPDNTYISYFTR